VWYHHGYGGAAPRSKGILHVDIDQLQSPDADIIVKGHDHNSWYVPTTVDRLNKSEQIIQRTVHNIRLGSYKLIDRSMGWEAEKGFNQSTVGGWYADIPIKRNDINYEEIEIRKL
jgi:hypothetical protein